MPRYLPRRSRRIRSTGNDVIIILIAILIVALLWSFAGLLVRLALFALLVYVVYRLLQNYL